MSINKILFWILVKGSTKESHQAWTMKAKYCNFCSLSNRWAISIFILPFLTQSWNSCNVCPMVSQSKEKEEMPSQHIFPNWYQPTPVPRTDTVWKTLYLKFCQEKFQEVTQNTDSTVHLWAPIRAHIMTFSAISLNHLIRSRRRVHEISFTFSSPAQQ